MSLDKKNLLKHLRDIVLITILGYIVSLLFDPESIFSIESTIHNLLYSFLIGASLWKGNEFIGYKIDQSIEWKKKPAKALIIHLLSMFIFSAIDILIINYLYYIYIWQGKQGYFFQAVFFILLIQIVITIIIASVLYSKMFFSFWREAAINEEKLKHERLAFQYESLKNQVNPHFLFNSLNALSSLVYKDPGLAEKFIKQLSEVYRYVLEQKDKEVIDIPTELKFVENYIYLQKIRYGNSLKFKNNLQKDNSKMLVPLSVQMLVENAIKHNIISEEEPLNIEIYNENNDYIIIKNNLQKKNVIKDSGNIGLSNIKARYEYLTDKPFIVESSAKDFIVKIPLLSRVSPYESHSDELFVTPDGSQE
ncbi:MAG: histidine kinase [Bacteroidales bacterium]|nr:histidine kinase [Bacteroidales bacterium]